MYSFTQRAQFVVLQDATVGSWLFALDAAVQEEGSVGPSTAQQAEDAMEAVQVSQNLEILLTPL